MPRLDGTGPLGQGPMTGRGIGPCRGGMVCPYGVGYGYGNRRFASPKNELAALEDEEQMLKDELAAVQEEISAVKTKVQ